MAVTILPGDCREVLAMFPAGYFQTCITSPPYFGLRDYGHAAQIGLEQTPADYVESLVAVFREVRRVLRDDGTVWLNLGDSYAGSGKDGNPANSPHQKQATNKGSLSVIGETSRTAAVSNKSRMSAVTKSGLKQKDLIGIPWRVAFALQADGWYLRSDIIWHKPNVMPNSVTDRVTTAHEYLFMLSKSPRYFFNHEAIKEPSVCLRQRGSGPMSNPGTGRNDATPQRNWLNNKSATQKELSAGRKRTGGKNGAGSFRAIREMRNKRSVWEVNTQSFKDAHFATFPPRLIEPCVLAGSNPGQFILDPFGGAGTTGLVASQYGRHAVLIELNLEYVAIAERRLK